MSVSYIVCKKCFKVMTRMTILVETEDETEEKYIQDEDILVEELSDNDQDHDWSNSKFWSTCSNCTAENPN